MRKRMRKIITIPGIALVVTILLISGSAVAWYYAVAVTDYERCVDPENALGQDDGDYASLGSTPLEDLGWIILDLGDYAMDADQEFTVFSSSSTTETYDVSVGNTSSINDFVYLYWGEDDKDCVFKTPAYVAGDGWRYIYIEGKSANPTARDPYYGPEIDAVGWQ